MSVCRLGFCSYLSFGEDCISFLPCHICHWVVRLFNVACFFCGSEALSISLPDGEERDRCSENILLLLTQAMDGTSVANRCNNQVLQIE